MRTVRWSLKDLNRINTTFENSKNPEILSRLETIGVGLEFVNGGTSLVSQIIGLNHDHKNEIQEKSQAFDKYKNQRILCQSEYNKVLWFVRIKTRFSPDIADRVRTETIPEFPVDEWHYHVDLFYKSLEKEPDIIEFLRARKFPDDVIVTNRANIKTLIELRNRVDTEKGQAEEVRRLRDSKFAELNDLWWMLKEYAKVALNETPQLLEELGVKVRS